MLIATHRVDIDFNEYVVELFDDHAAVYVIKTGRNGNSWRHRIKPDSQNFKKVLKADRQQSIPGSLAAEQLQQCETTR